MKCSESEKLIYLLGELDAKERLRLDEHLAKCTACTTLLARVQREQSIVKNELRAVPEKFENENPFLTAKIISAIQNDERAESVIEKFLPFMRFNLLRYSMAMISIVFLILFAAEVQPGQKVASAIQYYKQTPIRKTVQLNSVAFREQFMSSIRTNKPEFAATFSVSDCLRKCRGTTSEANCTECEKLLNQLKDEGI